jgi:hypothetical protein
MIIDSRENLRSHNLRVKSVIYSLIIVVKPWLFPRPLVVLTNIWIDGMCYVILGYVVLGLDLGHVSCKVIEPWTSGPFTLGHCLTNLWYLYDAFALKLFASRQTRWLLYKQSQAAVLCTIHTCSEHVSSFRMFVIDSNYRVCHRSWTTHIAVASKTVKTVENMDDCSHEWFMN